MTLTKLPMLGPHQQTLEKCVYCPKLCRATCPVSNAEPSESLTPWGKMSSSYFLARGDVPLEAEHAKLAWACTGCHACQKRCDHANPVAEVLLDARAGLAQAELMPEGAKRALQIARERERPVAGSLTTDVGLLMGCSYDRHLPEVSAQALSVVAKLKSSTPQRLDVCCGAPYRLAGDRAGFERSQARFSKAVAGVGLLVVTDPGCARTLLVDYPKAGVDLPKVSLLVDLAEENLHRFQRIPGAERPRYHDPCQLGRGLGRFDGPRRLLERMAGAAPLEFDRSRDKADCSGGGGLLPLTYPAASKRAAEQRLDQHHSAGGGTLVTACAASVRRFRTAGEHAEDLVTWLDRALQDA